jgi:hypothetical protein
MAVVNIASGLLMFGAAGFRVVASRAARVPQRYFASALLAAAAVYDVLTPLIGR